MDKHLSESAVIYQNERTAQRSIDGETIIIGVDDDYIHLLNDLGSFIWEKLQAGTNLNELVNNICEAFDVDSSTAKKDATEFISKLQDKNLIKLQ